MSPFFAPQRIHFFAEQVRSHGPALLAGMAEPHDELMSLVWGPRFDREHLLALLVRQPARAVHVLPVVLAAADAFDALPVGVQRRLRDLIRRHHALRRAAPGWNVAAPSPRVSVEAEAEPA